MPWFLPVQCFGQLSCSRSLNDQTLVYGSIVTSGTAGGRTLCWAAAVVANDASRTNAGASVDRARRTGRAVDVIVFMFLRLCRESVCYVAAGCWPPGGTSNPRPRLVN